MSFATHAYRAATQDDASWDNSCGCLAFLCIPTSRPHSANIQLKALGALRGIAVGAALWCSQVMLSSAGPERRGPIAKQDIRRTKALLNVPERLLLMPDTPCKAPVLGCYWLLLLGVASEGRRTKM